MVQEKTSPVRDMQSPGMIRSPRTPWIAAGLLVVLPVSLAGCLAVNAMLGVLGLVGPAPVQYAGTACSVAEYAYHYAVNDKTPDEVLGEKLAWLIAPAGEPAEQEFLLADAAPGPVGEPEPAAPEPGIGVSAGALVPVAPEPVMVASLAAPRPVATGREGGRPADSPVRRLPPLRQAAPARPETAPGPATAAFSGRASGQDPLSERLNRLESSLAQAERMYLRGIDPGVRCAASIPDGSGVPGISGTVSVRHPVMQAGPPATPDTVLSDAGNAPPLRS